MHKINEMKCGESNVEFIALISHVTTGKTNGANKSNYLNIMFQDETGTIDAKLWNASDEQIKTLTMGAVVKGVGDIIKYSDDRQMKVVKVIDVSYDESLQVQFVPKAPLESQDMMNQIHDYIQKMENRKIHDLVKYVFDKQSQEFQYYPAASRNHHDLVSGLAYHTLSMLKLADSILMNYPQLNADLVYAGVILHDIGKTVELSGPIVPNYTVEGKLLGHISIAQSMVHEAARELNIEGEEVILLQHMILSHHGKNEFGSPVLPQIREAEIVYFIDNIDARMNMFDKALSQVEPGEYSKRIFALENRMIYKPKMYNK